MNEDELKECPACEGTGITDEDDFGDCSTCHGDGNVYPEQQLN